MKSMPAHSTARTARKADSLTSFVLGFGFLIFALFSATLAQGEEQIIKNHGYSFFGDLKYPADFRHLDYVNPDAPKGGEISTWGFGTFDSMNPYSRKGTSGALASAAAEANAPDVPLREYGFIESNVPNPHVEISPPFGASGLT